MVTMKVIATPIWNNLQALTIRDTAKMWNLQIIHENLSYLEPILMESVQTSD
jgi:hypothetical protein